MTSLSISSVNISKKYHNIKPINHRYTRIIIPTVFLILMSSLMVTIPQYADAASEKLPTIINPNPDHLDFIETSSALTLDGIILIGAAYNDNTGAESSGSAYLFNVVSRDLLLAINNPTPGYYDHFGNSVAFTPHGNLLIGASGDNTGAESSGSVYLFNGTSGDLLLTINNPTPGYHDNFGNSVASTPHGNLLIGAKGDSTGSESSGSVYLFNGTSGDLLLTINNPTPGYYDHFGNSVASTPHGNLLIGAKGDNAGSESSGSAYLFNGVSGDLLLTINNPTPDDLDHFGNSVESIFVGNFLIRAAYSDNNIGAESSRFIGHYVFDHFELSLNNASTDIDIPLELLIETTGENPQLSFNMNSAENFVTLTDNSNGTATFHANPKISDGGIYKYDITVKDQNITHHKSFTLIVNEDNNFSNNGLKVKAHKNILYCTGYDDIVKQAPLCNGNTFVINSGDTVRLILLNQQTVTIGDETYSNDEKDKKIFTIYPQTNVDVSIMNNNGTVTDTFEIFVK